MIWIARLWANPLVRKITIYAVVSLAILYAFRIWLNRHDGKVYQEGKAAMAVEMEKAKKEQWKAKEAAIAKEAASVEAAQKQLKLDRIALSQTLSRRLSEITNERIRNAENIATIPASELDPALRSVSNELAANGR